MSQNNNNDAAVGIAFVIAGLAILGFVLFAMAAFISFAFTILALLAWNKPFQLTKTITVTPDEAHAFVFGGLAGAALVPAFAGFCQLMFGVQIQWKYLGFMIVFGYTLGSLGIAKVIGDQQNAQSEFDAANAARDITPPPAHRALPPSNAPEDFRFARWDDEERG